MGRPLIFSKELAERLRIGTIDLPNGYQLSATSMQIVSETGSNVRIKAEFVVRGPEVKPTNSDAAGGYVVPPELEDAVRTGLDIVQQPRTMPLEPDLSEWVDGSIKPTIEGVYERKYFSGTPDGFVCRYALWDGATWHTCSESVHGAALKEAYSSFQNRAWRGLRYDPSRSEGDAS
jgi:hypothetical protein